MVYHRRLGNASTLLLKSIIDRVLAAVMIVLLAPLMLLVALLVRIFIGPQILHIRRRGGLFGRPFSMLKFRTMRLGAEGEQAELAAKNEMDGPVFKIADDPRVTRLGRILRRTSIDELPQLFNVLVGQMSFLVQGRVPWCCRRPRRCTAGTGGGWRCAPASPACGR